MINDRIKEQLIFNNIFNDAINDEDWETVDAVLEGIRSQYVDRYNFYKFLYKLNVKSICNTIYFVRAALQTIALEAHNYNRKFNGGGVIFNTNISSSTNMVTSKVLLPKQDLEIDIYTPDRAGSVMEWDLNIRNLTNNTSLEFSGIYWNNLLDRLHKENIIEGVNLQEYKV